MSPVAGGLLTEFSMKINMKIKYESLIYSMPVDYCIRKGSTKKTHFLFISNKQCFTLQLNSKDSSLMKNDSISINTEELKLLSKLPVIACSFLKQMYRAEEKVQFLIGFSNGSIIKTDYNSKIYCYYNITPNKDNSNIEFDISTFVLPQNNTDVFYVLSRYCLLEYKTKDIIEPESAKKDYEVLKVLRSAEFFRDDKHYASIEKLQKKNLGRLECNRRSCLSTAWVNFEPRQLEDSSGSSPSKNEKLFTSAWRFNLGYITSIKVIAVGSNWRNREGQVTDIFRKKDQSSAMDEFKVEKTTDMIALFTGNDGHIRVYSLWRNEYYMVMQYNMGGISYAELNEDYSMMAIGTQDDSFLIVSLEQSTAIKISIHSSFVTFCGFYNHINKLMKARSKTARAGEGLIRVVSASMDESISVVDVHQSYFSDRQSSVSVSEPYQFTLQYVDGNDKKVEKNPSVQLVSLESMVIEEVSEQVSGGKKLLVQQVKCKVGESKFGFSAGRIFDSMLGLYVMDTSISFFDCTISESKLGPILRSAVTESDLSMSPVRRSNKDNNNNTIAR